MSPYKGDSHSAPSKGLSRSDRGLPWDTVTKFGKYGFKFPININLNQFKKQMVRKMTKAECKFWFEIAKNLEEKWIRQKVIENFIVDFYCHKLGLVVEIDGESHDNKKEYDLLRTNILEQYGLLVVRFTNEDVLSNIDGVWNKMQQIIQKRKKSLKCTSK